MRMKTVDDGRLGLIFVFRLISIMHDVDVIYNFNNCYVNVEKDGMNVCSRNVCLWGE